MITALGEKNLIDKCGINWEKNKFCKCGIKWKTNFLSAALSEKIDSWDAVLPEKCYISNAVLLDI